MNRTLQAMTPAPILLFAFLAAPAASPAAAADDGTVTFSRDIAPILQRSCQRCHRPGTASPMSLLTYEQTRPWARSIKRRVASRPGTSIARSASTTPTRA